MSAKRLFAIGFALAFLFTACAPTTPAQASISFGVKKTRIEVVDKVPAQLNVGEAVRFYNRYATTQIVVVAKCSHEVGSKCITVRTGKLGTSKKTVLFGWSQNGTITIDVSKMKRYGMYGPKTRQWVVTHELGHQLGLGHSRGNNVMYQYARIRGSVPHYVLTTAQKRLLSTV